MADDLDYFEAKMKEGFDLLDGVVAGTTAAGNATQWNGKAMPANAAGALQNDGSGTLSWHTVLLNSPVTKSVDTVYLAEGDGLLVVYHKGGTVTGLSDASNPPTTVRVANTAVGSVDSGTIVLPVLKGQYYKFTAVNVSTGPTAVWYYWS